MKPHRYQDFAAAELELNVARFDDHLIESGIGCPDIESVVQNMGIESDEAGAGCGEREDGEEGVVGCEEDGPVGD